jgi:hypothetical protein
MKESGHHLFDGTIPGTFMVGQQRGGGGGKKNGDYKNRKNKKVLC